MLWERVKTALLIAPFAIAVLLLGGPVLTLVSFLLFLVINFEYFHFAAKFPRGEALLLTAIASLPTLGFLGASYQGYVAGAFLALSALFCREIVTTEREVHDRTLTDALSKSVLGLCYTGMLGSSLVLLCERTAEGRFVLWGVLIVVLTDTFAYFGGRALGGPKLASRVSPKKTVWGAVVGGVFAVLGGVGFGVLLEVPASVWVLGGLSAVVTVFSQFGDLLESYVKRLAGIKDISNLLPGHGGVLDRIDGLIFAAVPLYLLAPWVVR